MLIQARNGIVTAFVLVGALMVLPGTALAADPVVQFQPIPMQNDGSTLAGQEIVKFWSAKDTQDSTPTATVDWGDGTPIDTTTPTAVHDGCAATPDGSNPRRLLTRSGRRVRRHRRAAHVRRQRSVHGHGDTARV
jgi:hypothetical protein